MEKTDRQELIYKLKLLEKVIFLKTMFKHRNEEVSYFKPTEREYSCASPEKAKQELLELEKDNEERIEDENAQINAVQEKLDSYGVYKREAILSSFKDAFPSIPLLPFILAELLVGVPAIIISAIDALWWIGVITAVAIFLGFYLYALFGEFSIITKKKEIKATLKKVTDEISLARSNRENKIEEKKSEIKSMPERSSKYEVAKEKYEKFRTKFKEQYEVINKTLRKVKSKNPIVTEKYFNLPDICIFIDYLSSGRCSELEGPYGCYNLLEFEKNTKQIIANLEDINLQLSDIRKGMDYLCQEVTKLNRVVERFADSMANAAANLETSASSLMRLVRDTEYIKACQTFLIADNLPYATKELTLFNALSDIKY